MRSDYVESYIVMAISVCVLLLLTVIHIIMKSEHPVRSAIFSLLPGPAAVICINLFSEITSVAVPVSPLTLAVSAVLGIPGVTAMLIVQRIL